MWACAATAVACQCDDGAGMDVGAFGDESLGEVAIAAVSYTHLTLPTICSV